MNMQMRKWWVFALVVARGSALSTSAPGFSRPLDYGTSCPSHARLCREALRSEPPHAEVEVRSAGARGAGVFARVPIERARMVGWYRGSVLNAREVRERDAARRKRPATMAEVLASPPVERANEYVFRVDPDCYLDASDEADANWTRFINHSARRPNLRVEIDCGGDPMSRSPEPLVYFVAEDDIGAGAELLFDYGEEYWRGHESKVFDP